MQSVTKTYKAKIEIKKSNFLSFLCPFDEFKTLLKSLKEEHLKAVHFVWAYRFLNEFGQVVEDKSDDFEPKGSAGMPMLNVLRGFELINTACVVVRYFGGVKLGVGGLVRAYSKAVNLAINEASLVPFELKTRLSILCSFKSLSKIEYFLHKNLISFEKEFLQDKIKLNLKLNESQKIELLNLSKNFNPLEFEIL